MIYVVRLCFFSRAARASSLTLAAFLLAALHDCPEYTGRYDDNDDDDDYFGDGQTDTQAAHFFLGGIFVFLPLCMCNFADWPESPPTRNKSPRPRFQCKAMPRTGQPWPKT